eukprot:TRINITY_DN39057_c0_g1_i1.p1 TRINITY_DN39057_c0_g1~~TRINITY_DN39057_c0_g1_i1.p1  ORF type:complete len:666 (-),score=97.61 TRINITY_DN39057_c0_g1_i1:9-2006(-)
MLSPEAVRLQETSSSSRPGPSIFVSIASYRDNQCQYTLQDLFQKAHKPERVVAGVCFQVAEDDTDSFLIDLGEWSEHVRTYFLRHTEAKGPCYARALIQQELYKGEDYYFQIDSHFRFVDGWDEVCLDQLSRCESPRAILTAYASSYSLPDDYEPGRPDQAVLSAARAPTILCADSFGDATGDDPFLRIKTRACRSDFDHVPPPALFWTARFAFSQGRVVNEVPYDPHLEYLFFGEEIAMSARLWTAGWDFFNPTKVIAFHLSSRAHRQWFREVQTSPEQVQRELFAKYRVCGLLGHAWPNGQTHAPPSRPYCLGDSRSLAEYERFAGISFHNVELSERARDGGVAPDLLPPRWADEERDKVLRTSQLRDVASWAGKGNDDALERQFPDVASTPINRPPMDPESERARELTRMRIQALQFQLQRATTSEARSELNVQLSRAFASFGQLEANMNDERGSASAYERALEHAEASRAENRAGANGGSALMRGLGSAAVAVARLGLRQYVEAKESLHEALAHLLEAAAEADMSSGVENPPDPQTVEQLAYDVADCIHAAHERTDDRQGLEGYVAGLRALLTRVRRLAGDSEVPLIATSRAGNSEPPMDGEVSVRARFLERVTLIAIATGRERDQQLARSVFEEFRTARESPNLRKLLGMLQSSGMFLDL